jgi:DNA-binding transcriptional LysR family regulator
MISPEIRHLKAFVAVAEDLHFSRAAVRLNIVQPALSMQIRTLEDMLGVRLFNRTRRDVSLTEPGRLFLEEAKRVLGQLDRAVDVVRRAGRGEAGRLAIGYSAATAYSGLLSRVVGAFHKQYPDVVLTIREMHPALQREALRQGDLDVGFVVSDVNSQAAEFESHVVETWAVSAVLAETHPLCALSVVPVERLRHEPFISYEALGEDLAVDAFRSVFGFRPDIAHYAENPIMLLSLVSAGFGYSIVPASLQNAGIPGAKFIAVDRLLPELLAVSLSREGHVSQVLKRFLEMLV